MYSREHSKLPSSTYPSQTKSEKDTLHCCAEILSTGRQERIATATCNHSSPGMRCQHSNNIHDGPEIALHARASKCHEGSNFLSVSVSVSYILAQAFMEHAAVSHAGVVGL
jgi:hypothetical protein